MHNRKTIGRGPVKALVVTFGDRPHITNEIDPHQWIFGRICDLLDWREGLEVVKEYAEWLSEHDPDIDALVNEYRLNQGSRFSRSIPTSTPW